MKLNARHPWARDYGRKTKERPLLPPVGIPPSLTVHTMHGLNTPHGHCHTAISAEVARSRQKGTANRLMLGEDMKLLSFDIETSNVFELRKHEDIEKYAPFHISVAATVVHDGEERVWYSVDEEGRPALNLTRECAHDLLEYLDEMQQKGFMVCAWNGLGFDLKWIGHQADDMALAARIALKIYDPMFQFFNQAGFPVGLGKVAEGMSIPQEKLMDGADAPKQWRAGNHQEVMDYCLNDCLMTNLIVGAIQEAGEVRWVTGKGHISSKPMPRLKTVEEVIQDPEPDQSWMDNPILKTRFYEWVQEAT
jgi:hypothetical protein